MPPYLHPSAHCVCLFVEREAVLKCDNARYARQSTDRPSEWLVDGSNQAWSEWQAQDLQEVMKLDCRHHVRRRMHQSRAGSVGKSDPIMATFWTAHARSDILLQGARLRTEFVAETMKIEFLVIVACHPVAVR